MCRPSFSSTALVLLILARCFSALLNIVHDCDEVYNYWEPLHRLVYGFGKQPWEYSPQYALRSYLYILIHWAIAAPLAWIVGDGKNKIIVFYGLRSVFGMISASLEFQLFRNVSQMYPDAAVVFLVVLVFNTGMSVACSAFLPSTFAMYCMTAATTAFLERRNNAVIFWAVIGVILGWPVCGIAFMPYAVYILFQPRLLESIFFLALSTAAVAVPLVLCDCHLYGTWTMSVWNFIQYNVVGGGQSALYGVDSSTYYLMNGGLNFNVMLSMAALLPVLGGILALHRQHSKWKSHDEDTPLQTGLPTVANMNRFLWVCSPAFVWILALSLLPHKEERFLFVVYPQICLSAALSLALVTHWVLTFCDRFPNLKRVARVVSVGFLAVYASLSCMRLATVWSSYSAPMAVYRRLPEVHSEGRVNVCAGDEWHRFPSSFFLPSRLHRLGFVQQNFDGLLPADFSEDPMGTRSNSTQFNDQNRQIMDMYVDISSCQFVVDFETRGRTSLSELYDSEGRWLRIHQLKILDRENSPLQTRLFYLPFLDRHLNQFGDYVLYETRK